MVRDTDASFRKGAARVTPHAGHLVFEPNRKSHIRNAIRPATGGVLVPA
jgi:hypothetical protein